MTTQSKGKQARLDDHRKAMIAIARAINARGGIPEDTNITAEQVQEMMRSLGIRPEENLFSQDIICSRYQDEEK